MVEISWINDNIAVSGAILDEDIPHLKNAGINAIIDVRSEYCDNEYLIEKTGLKFLHVEIDDRYSPTIGQLKEIFDFADPLLDKREKILIHCQNGCGRAPLVAVAILARRGMNVPEAVGLVEDKHPWTGFSPQQEKFLKNRDRHYS